MPEMASVGSGAAPAASSQRRGSCRRGEGARTCARRQQLEPRVRVLRAVELRKGVGVYPAREIVVVDDQNR